MTTRLSLTFPLACLAALAIPAAAQTIHAPSRIVAGDAVPVRVDGLPPGAIVDLVAERGTTRRLRSTARYRADRSGVVDLSRDAPLAGDYSGRDPAGLFWSMRPAPAASVARQGSGGMHLTASIGGRQVAAAHVAELAMEPDLTEIAVQGFPGARLYRHAARRALPVAILLGGSEGGDSFGNGMVPFVTRQGYAALILPYYAPSWVANDALRGLPADFADIPVDRLEGVHRWIAGQPGLDARRIVVIGASKGGEFAMLAAAHYPWLRAVVGIVPSDVVWEGWGPSVQQDDTRASFAWRGKPLPWVPYSGMRAWLASVEKGGSARLADVHAAGRAAHPERIAAATIPVDRFKGPMLIVGGGRDETWPSAQMVRNIADRRRAAGRSTQALVFPGAGHNLSGSGWTALRAYGDDPTAEATARAQLVVRARLTRFLRRAR